MSFNNYTKDLGLSKPVDFIYTSPEGVAWFDPLKPYTVLEYEWVMTNVDLEGKTVIDAGCHQGNYAVLFAAMGATVIGIDAHAGNCEATRLNLDTLYPDGHQVHNQALWRDYGTVRFSGESNGRIIAGGGVEVPCLKLSKFDWADVVKVDIESAEFAVVPQALEEMPEVGTWIIEIHPDQNPAIIIDALKSHGFSVHLVDRDTMTVHPYHTMVWTSHATVIGVRK